MLLFLRAAKNNFFVLSIKEPIIWYIINECEKNIKVFSR